MKINNTKDLASGERVTSLSIGDSGKGKTFFAATIADYGKPFIIDAECGLATAADKDIDFTTVNTWAEFLSACAWYFKNYEAKGYTHLVVDSLTRLQSYRAKELSDTGKLTISQWGEILADLRAVTDRLTKHCPTSLHINAMAMESKDELSGAIKIFPNIQGAFKHDLAGYFDVVLYHDCAEKKGEQVYWVQTKGDQRVSARNRYDSINPMKKHEPNNYGIIARTFKKEIKK